MATSQMIEANRKGFKGSTTLAIYRRVVVSSGLISYAGATDTDVGVTMSAVLDTTNIYPVQLASAYGTVKMTANGAITANAAVFAAASGKVASSGGVYVGVALQSAAADGDVIEVLRKPADKSYTAMATVAATGSTQGDAAALSAGLNWVTAADATKGAVLPTGVTGIRVIVKNDETAAAILKIYPPTGGKINNLSTNAALSMAAGTSAEFYCYDGTQWFTVPKVPS